MAREGRYSVETDWLKRETTRWVKEGILSSAQAERILSLYLPPGEELKKDPTRFLVAIFILLAIALAGVGTILFFAAVWGNLSAGERIAIVLAGLGIAHAARLLLPILRQGWLAREGTELALAFLFGLAIFQIDQNLNLNLSTEDLLILWSIGISLPLLLLKAESTAILLAVLITVWGIQGFSIGDWDLANRAGLWEALRFYGFLPFWVLAVASCGMSRPVGIAVLAGVLLRWLGELPLHWPPGFGYPGLQMYWLVIPSYFGFVGACFWLVSTSWQVPLPGWWVIRGMGILLAAGALIAEGSLRFPGVEVPHIETPSREITLWFTLLATLGAVAGLIWIVLRVGQLAKTEQMSPNLRILAHLFTEPSWKIPAILLFLFWFWFAGELLITIWSKSNTFSPWQFLAMEIPWINCFSANAVTIALAIYFFRQGQRQQRPTWLGLAAVYLVVWIIARLQDHFGLELRDAANIFFSAAVLLGGMYFLVKRLAPPEAEAPEKTEDLDSPVEFPLKPLQLRSSKVYPREGSRRAVGGAFAWQVAVLTVWMGISLWPRLTAPWVVEVPVSQAWSGKSPFRGAYLTLKFPFTEVNLAEIEGLNLPVFEEESRTLFPPGRQEALRAKKMAKLVGQPIYLLFSMKDDEKGFRPAGFSVNRPEKGPFIRGTITSVWQLPLSSPHVETTEEANPLGPQQPKPDWLATVIFGIERISVPERTLPEWEEAIRAGKVFAKVAISPTGHAFILELQKIGIASRIPRDTPVAAGNIQEANLSPSSP